MTDKQPDEEKTSAAKSGPKPAPMTTKPPAAAGRSKKRSRKKGRPVVWTTALENEIVKWLQSGCSFKDAAEIAGIHYETLKERQRSTKPKDRAFSARLARERILFKGQNLALVSMAATTRWQAAAWLLERMHPDEFALRRLEVTGANGGELAVQVNHAPSLDPEFRKNLATVVSAFAENIVARYGGGAGDSLSGVSRPIRFVEAIGVSRSQGVDGSDEGGSTEHASNTGAAPPANRRSSPRRRGG